MSNQLKPAAARSDAACGQSLAFQSWSAWRAPFGLARAFKVATMESMILSIIGSASDVAFFALISAGTALADPKRRLVGARRRASARGPVVGGALCATIATPKSAADPETGRPWTDKNNPDPALRNRPLVGASQFLVPWCRRRGPAGGQDASTTSTTRSKLFGASPLPPKSTPERSGSKAAP